MQQRSVIRTRQLINNWSGKLLERVAKPAVEKNEPPLTSLCVHQDGTIGDGYLGAPKSVDSDLDGDVDDLPLRIGCCAIRGMRAAYLPMGDIPC